VAGRADLAKGGIDAYLWAAPMLVAGPSLALARWTDL